MYSICTSLNVCSFDTAKVLARQSKDCLRSLVLRNQKSIDLQEVLESMPSLQVMKISKAIIGQETLRLLATGDIGAQLWEIAVGLGAEQDVVFDAWELLNMIQARQETANEEGSSVAFFHSVSFSIFHGHWKNITKDHKRKANNLGKKYGICISFWRLNYIRPWN